jgi:SAM-dependent MidA family methyltransferase
MDFFEGRIFEVNLEAIDWLRTVSSWLRFGYLMIIDYGDISRVLYSPGRRDGTLRCFYKHILTDSPLERVGLQDITADVNFSTLIDHGQELGFDVVSFETQRAFLIRKQLPERIARSEKPSLSVKSFLIPGGASENFRVLILKKPRH